MSISGTLVKALTTYYLLFTIAQLHLNNSRQGTYHFLPQLKHGTSFMFVKGASLYLKQNLDAAQRVLCIDNNVARHLPVVIWHVAVTTRTSKACTEENVRNKLDIAAVFRLYDLG